MLLKILLCQREDRWRKKMETIWQKILEWRCYRSLTKVSWFFSMMETPATNKPQTPQRKSTLKYFKVPSSNCLFFPRRKTSKPSNGSEDAYKHFLFPSANLQITFSFHSKVLSKIRPSKMASNFPASQFIHSQWNSGFHFFETVSILFPIL